MRFSSIVSPALLLACVASVVGVASITVACVGDDPTTSGDTPTGPSDGGGGSDAPSTTTGDSGGTKTPTLSVTASLKSISVVASTSVTFDVAVVRGGGLDGPVNVTLTGLPGGVTAAPVTIAANQTSATVTVLAGESPTQGVKSIGVSALSGDGAVGGTAAIELVVRGLAGGLDTSFAGTGVVADASLQINAIGLDAKGNIVLGGSAPAAGPFADNFGAVRLTPDGKLDPAFGTAGLFKTTLGSPLPGRTFVRSLAIDDTTGAISLAGIVTASSSQEMGMLRIDSTGKLDPTLGLNGIGPTHSGGVTGNRVRLHAGKAYIIGFASSVIGGNIAVGRVGDTGFDTTFGIGGMATVADYLKTNDGVVQPDGKILVCGIAGPDGGDENASVWRLNADGTIDTAFAASGNYLYDLPTTQEGATSLALLDAGRIIVGGYQGSGGAGSGLWVQVLLPNGAVDNTFHEPITKPGNVSSILVQPDGLIVLVGTSGSNPFVWRLLKSGTPDPAFNGGSPVVATDVTTSFVTPNAALDSYNRVLVATGSAVVRFWL